jgi:hypothetical protein
MSKVQSQDRISILTLRQYSKLHVLDIGLWTLDSDPSRHFKRFRVEQERGLAAGDAAQLARVVEELHQAANAGVARLFGGVCRKTRLALQEFADAV